MRSGTIRFGEFLILVGVFVLALQYVNWSAFTPWELADFVIVGGVVLLICFALALWSRSALLDELLHLIVLIVSAVVLGLLVSGSGASALIDFAAPVRADKTLSFDGSFAPDVTPTVTIDLVNGGATVQTWERETVQITIRARARAWSKGEAKRILDEAALQPQLSPTGIVFIAPRQRLFGFSRLETDVQVLLPRGRVYELNLESVNGELVVQDANAAQASLKTVNGRIKLSNLTVQRVTLGTINGDISGRLAASDANASTTDGEIDLILGAVTGSYTLSTLNGEIELDVPDEPQIGYAISAQSTVSRVTVRLPGLVFSEQERRRIKGVTSNFESAATKISIKANTTNGSIEIR